MVESKGKDKWNDWFQEGELNKEINVKLEDLFEKYLEGDPKSIFLKNSGQLTKEFVEKVNNDLDLTFARFPKLSAKESSLKRNLFISDLRERLDLLHNKKALCKISFDAYSFDNFIKSCSDLVDEIEFRINKNNIHFTIMDSSRINLFRVNLSTKNYSFFKEGKLAINLEDLYKVLTCNAGDQSSTTLLFGQEQIFITIRSEKFKSEIKRTIKGIDLEIEEIPLDHLEDLVYPFAFIISKEKLEYTLKNLGVYSEVIGININEDILTFHESGQLGSGEIIWMKHQLKTLHFNQVLLEKNIKKSEKSELKAFLSSR